jgi:hypothetical protein
MNLEEIIGDDFIGALAIMEKTKQTEDFDAAPSANNDYTLFALCLIYIRLLKGRTGE